MHGYTTYSGGPLQTYLNKQVEITARPLHASFSEMGGRLAIALNVEEQLLLCLAEAIDCYHSQDIATLVNSLKQPIPTMPAQVTVWGKYVQGSARCAPIQRGQGCEAPQLEMHGIRIQDYQFFFRSMKHAASQESSSPGPEGSNP